MVTIKLPNTDKYPQDVKGFLRQLELAVHHLEKSYDQFVEDDVEAEDPDSDERMWASFEFPKLPDEVADEYRAELQEVEISINQL